MNCFCLEFNNYTPSNNNETSKLHKWFLFKHQFSTGGINSKSLVSEMCKETLLIRTISLVLEMIDRKWVALNQLTNYFQ